MNLNEAVFHVNRLRLGESILFDPREFEFDGFDHNGEHFRAADRILENIPGSSYEYSYRYAMFSNDVVFERRKEPLDNACGLRSYVSPDQRDYYRKRTDGLWEPIKES